MLLYTLLAASLLCLAQAQLNFMILGDWGGQPVAPYTTDAEREVAEQLGKTAASVGSQFTLALGDNFYDTGVKDVHDPRFQETFEVSTMLDLFPYFILPLCAQKVFTAEALQSRWYVICGNHDHYGNVSAEVAYTKLSQRWYMPDLYYTEVGSAAIFTLLCEVLLLISPTYM